MSETAARRYSVALFETGKEQNKIDSFLEQIKDIAMTLSDYKELMELLTHPNIDTKEKKNVFQEIFKDKADEEVTKLIILLIDHGRIKEIKLIYEEYRSLVYKFKGIKTAYVTTAVKMTDEEIDILREKLSKKYNSKIEIENFIDTSIIGGVYLKVEDEVIDGTVKGNLEQMRKEIMKHGSEVRA
jgi:F-type H+-transporting ATPase subunit delta